MSLIEAENAEAKDPVCGMSVDPADARFRADHDGRTFSFCSAGCREKFAADPDRYLAIAGAVADRAGRAQRAGLQRPVPAGTIFTCPMHPEVRREGPGACPICGMALEPEQPSLEEGRTPSSPR